MRLTVRARSDRRARHGRKPAQPSRRVADTRGREPDLPADPNPPRPRRRGDGRLHALPPAQARGDPAAEPAGTSSRRASPARSATRPRMPSTPPNSQLAQQESVDGVDAGEAAAGTAAATKAASPARRRRRRGRRGAQGPAEAGPKAIRDHKVLVVLFSNGKSDDDKAVARRSRKSTAGTAACSSTPPRSRKISKYGRIARGVSVEQSPTVVVADRNLRAETLVGYVDRATIDQAVVDARRNSGGIFTTVPEGRRQGLLAALERVDSVPFYYGGGSVPRADRRWPISTRVIRPSSPTSAVKAPAKYAAFKGATVADLAAAEPSWRASAPVTPRRARRRSSRRRQLQGCGAPDREALQQALRRRRTCTAAARSSEPDLDSVLVEAFREHLEHPAGRGVAPARRARRRRRRRRLR